MSSSGRGSSTTLVQELTAHGRPVALDLSDERQLAHVLDRWRSAGRTPERMPQLHRALERTRALQRRRRPETPPPSPLDATPIATLTGLSTTGAGETLAIGSAVCSSPGDIPFTGVSLRLYRADTDEPIGEQVDVDVFGYGLYVPIQAAGALPEPGVPLRADFLATTTSAAAGDAVPELRVVAQSALVGAFPSTPPKVTAPVQKPGRTVDYTMVCLLRSFGDDGDCDYGPYGSNTVVVPVSGSIAYPGAIAPLTAQSADVSLSLISRKSGGGQLYATSALLPSFAIGPEPRQLSWSIAPASFGVGDPFARYEYVDVSLQFAVSIEGMGTMISAWVSSAADVVDGPSVTKIPPLQFATGCLAAGTPVTLADGSERPIELLAPGDRVRARADGAVLTATSTGSGPERAPLVWLRTAGGRELALSEAHPVLGAGGEPIAAAELALGDRVATLDGAQPIAALARRPYDGLVWNAKLGTDAERARLGVAAGTCFAGGVLVGDGDMQAAAAQPAVEQRSTDDVLAALPPAWHEDFLATR